MGEKNLAIKGRGLGPARGWSLIRLKSACSRRLLQAGGGRAEPEGSNHSKGGSALREPGTAFSNFCF